MLVIRTGVEVIVAKTSLCLKKLLPWYSLNFEPPIFLLRQTNYYQLISETRKSSARASETGAIFRGQESEHVKLRHELEGDGAKDLRNWKHKTKFFSVELITSFSPEARCPLWTPGEPPWEPDKQKSLWFQQFIDSSCVQFTCGSLLHGAPFFPVVLASVFLISLACTLKTTS